MSFLKTMINSVARTFGRILAYVLIGLAIYFIASQVHAQPQYRISTTNWSSWSDLTLDNSYTFSTSLGTSWSSYIQIKDTVAFANNSKYNLNSSMEFTVTQSGSKEINSALDPYIFNGSTLTNVSDKCTLTGTRSDKTTSPVVSTTHTYKININCINLTTNNYYPYMVIRFKTNSSSAAAFTFKVTSWEYHLADSNDATNIMNNQNQNTQTIINNNYENTQEIINNQNENTQEIVNVGEDIVEGLGATYSALTSDNVPNESTINSVFGDIGLTDETPMTNLLVFPLIVFSFFGNNINASCSPVSLGTLFNHEIVLPCISLVNIFGVSLWNILDLLCMFYMLYNIVHLFIGIFEDISELRSPFLRFFIKNRGALNND